MMHSRFSKHTVLSFALLAAFCCFGSTLAHAQVQLAARRPNTNEALKPLQLKTLAAEVTIEDNIATTHIDQTFANGTSERLEGIYNFTLPEGAAVTDLILWVGDKPQQAQILERSKATFIYNGIVNRMQDPALLNYVGRNRFNLRIFPIEPNSERRIELTYSQVVPFHGGRFDYSLPLTDGSGEATIIPSMDIKVRQKSVRAIYDTSYYNFGGQAQTSGTAYEYSYANHVDNAKADRPFTYSYRLGFTPTLLPATWRGNDKNTYFALQIVAPPPAKAAVAAAAEEDAKLAASKNSKKTTTPRPAPDAPDHVILLLDASGSMRGARWQRAQQIASAIAEALPSQTRISLMAFNSEVWRLADEKPPGQQAPADWVKNAIEGAEIIGGSNFEKGLREAKLAMRAMEANTAVLLISDGSPTLGERDPQRLSDALLIGAENTPLATWRVRLFTIGVGENDNDRYLRNLATAGGGDFYTMASSDGPPLESLASTICNDLTGAGLNHLRVQFRGGDRPQLYPQIPDSLPLGAATFVFGRGKKLAHQIVAQAYDESRSAAERWEAMLPTPPSTGGIPDASRTGLAAIPALWAKQKVDELASQLNWRGAGNAETDRDNEEVLEEISALSAYYHIITPYTSLLVVDPQMGELAHSLATQFDMGRVQSTLAIPATTSTTPVMGPLGPTGAAGPMGPQGPQGPAGPPAALPADLVRRQEIQDAIAKLGETNKSEISRLEIAYRRDAPYRLAAVQNFKVKDLTAELPKWIREQGVPATAEALVQVEKKTFFFDGARWKDTECLDVAHAPGTDRVFTIAPGTKAYVQLLEAQPKLAKYLALGTGTVICSGDVRIEVVNRGVGEDKELAPADLTRLRNLTVE